MMRDSSDAPEVYCKMDNALRMAFQNYGSNVWNSEFKEENQLNQLEQGKVESALLNSRSNFGTQIGTGPCKCTKKPDVCLVILDTDENACFAGGNFGFPTAGVRQPSSGGLGKNPHNPFRSQIWMASLGSDLSLTPAKPSIFGS